MSPDCGYTIAPHVILRVNELPFSSLGAERTGELAAHIRALHDAIQWNRDAKQHIIDELYRAAESAPSEVRHEVLNPLKRDVFNERATAVPLPRVLPHIDHPDVRRWYENQDRLATLRVAIDEGYRRALDEERGQLQRFCQDPRLQRALTISSLSAYRAAAAYAETPVADHNGRRRKSEPGIVQYVTRALTRTTPFSLYTNVGVGYWRDQPAAPDPLQLPEGRVTVASVDHARVWRFLDVVLRHPSIARQLTYRLCPDLRTTADALEFDIYIDEPVTQPRVFRTTQRRGSVRSNAVVRVLVGWLKETAPRGRPYHAITAAVGQWVGGASEAAAQQFVDRLIEAGLLAPMVPVPEQSLNVLGDLSAFLRSIPAELSRSLAPLIDEIASTLRGFGTLGATERLAAMTKIDALWSEAFSAVGSTPPDTTSIYEDAGLARPVELAADGWRDALDDLARLMAALEAFDLKAPLKRIIRDEFVRRYGVGGVCDDINEAAALVPDIYARLFKALMRDGSEPLGREDATLAALDTLQVRFINWLIANAATHPAGLEIDDAIIDEMTRGIPATQRADAASYGAFVQPIVRDGGVSALVLNHVYNGLGMFISRFLYLFDAAATDQLRSHIRSVYPPDRLLAEIRTVCGFNGNLHPQLTEYEIDGDDGESLTNISGRELRFHHDVATDAVILRHAATNRHVEVLYLGVLVPYLLPQRTRLLYSMSGSGQLNVPFHALAELAAPAETRAGIRRYPRVTYRRVVLFRRRWYMSRDLIPAQGASESDAEYFARLQRWRIAEDLPREFFFREHSRLTTMEKATDAEDWRQRISWARSKPQYIDVESPILVRYFAKWLRNTTSDHDVFFEEVLPGFADSAFRTGSAPHVTEAIVECVRRAASPASGDLTCDSQSTPSTTPIAKPVSFATV